MERLLKISFAIALLVYFVFAVAARTPAQWATKALVDAVPGLSIGGVSGTVWKGSAASAVLTIQRQDFDLGRLTWRVHPSSLLGLKLCADVSSDLIEAKACRSLSGSNRIQDLILEEFPAKQLDNLLGFAKIQGTFGLVVRNVQVSDKGIVKAIDGNVRWDGARGDAGGGWFDLGSFSADIKENGAGGVLANITDTAGQFELNLNGEYSIEGGPSLSGTVKPRPEAPVQLVDSLGFLTQPQDDGSFLVSWPM